MKQYNIIVCGGTFDLLHAGHREFLQQIFGRGEQIIVGLTSDQYIQKFKPHKNVSSFEFRKKTLENFVKENGVEKRLVILPIDDLYGPLLDPQLNVDAIAVTPHSFESAQKVNKERVEKGLSALEIIEIPLLKDEKGEIISSTKIRKNLLLPSTLRPLLQDTWGKIITEVPLGIEMNKVITVGDVTTGKFIEKKLFPKICIIDNRIERKDRKFEYNLPSDYARIVVENLASHVSRDLYEVVEKGIYSPKTLIIVNGEEDLSVLPALLSAPVGFSIFYGQPGVGMVQLEVTEEPP